VDALTAARREFHEETGSEATGELTPLTPLKQASGKTVHAWAVRGDIDPASVVSNTFLMEWPPKSGRQQEFPEVDRAAWFAMELAERKILKAQSWLLRQLRERVCNPHARPR